jgi:hypothetical protein
LKKAGEIRPFYFMDLRGLTHIKKHDDCFGDFLVRVVCECGACREIQRKRSPAWLAGR